MGEGFVLPGFTAFETSTGKTWNRRDRNIDRAYISLHATRPRDVLVYLDHFVGFKRFPRAHIGECLSVAHL